MGQRPVRRGKGGRPVQSGGADRIDESRAVYKSPLVTRKTPGQSVAIDVDITGAKKLYLVVDDGGDGYVCDHADWIEPKLRVRKAKKLTSLKWISATCGWGKVAVGRSASGKQLIVDGKTFADGIGTHAQSIIEYDLPAGYTRFTARGGLDQGGVSQKIGAPPFTFWSLPVTHARIANRRPSRFRSRHLGLQDHAASAICGQERMQRSPATVFRETSPYMARSCSNCNPAASKSRIRCRLRGWADPNMTDFTRRHSWCSFLGRTGRNLLDLELRLPLFLPTFLAPPRDVQESMDHLPQTSLATNADAEFTVFMAATGTALLLGTRSSSPHGRSPANKKVAGKPNAV